MLIVPHHFRTNGIPTNLSTTYIHCSMIHSTILLKKLVLWRSFCLFGFGMSIMIEVFSIRLSSIGSIDLPSLSFPSEQTTHSVLASLPPSCLLVLAAAAAAQCLTDHSSSPNKMPLWPPPRRPIISEKGQQGLLHHQLSLSCFLPILLFLSSIIDESTLLVHMHNTRGVLNVIGGFVETNDPSHVFFINQYFSKTLKLL